MNLTEITVLHEDILKIDARKLYTELGFLKKHFTRWSKKNIEDNPFLIENFDWWKTETIIFEEEENFENTPTQGEQNFENTPTQEEQKNETIIFNDDVGNNDTTEQKPSRIKKDYVLSFDMTLHLLLQNPNSAGFEIRQNLINHRKKEIENKRKIAELSIINQSEKSEIKELKKQRFAINKRLSYLHQKTENQDNELHFINTGQLPKVETRLNGSQTSLFLE